MVGLIGLPIGYGVYERYWLMFPVGGRCQRDNQCRGFRSFCLSLDKPVQVGAMTWLPSQSRSGVCSTNCSNDRDCLPSWKCVNGGIYELAPGQGPVVGGLAHATKLCAPRASDARDQ
jgi:hypothetical protein